MLYSKWLTLQFEHIIHFSIILLVVIAIGLLLSFIFTEEDYKEYSDEEYR